MMTRRKLAAGAGLVALGGVGAYAWTDDAPRYEDVSKEVWARAAASSGNQLQYLVHHATLAANSHNTQPWSFSAQGDDRITIAPDLARATPAADPDGHHLYASLGCACENLTLAAIAQGKGASVNYNPEANGKIEIRLADSVARSDPLFQAIAERQCTRSDYDGRKVSAADLKRLEGAAGIEGCRLQFITDAPTIEKVLELAVAANTRQIEDQAFSDELKSWLRFNGSHAARTRDGLYSACAGNPSMPPFLGKLMFGLAFKPGPENDKLSKQVRSSSGLAVLITEKDDKTHWVQSGRSYQRFALQSTALGIRHAFVNQPVDVPTIRSEFSKLLGIEGGRADLVVRFGYASAMPRSLRRPVNSVIV